MADELFKLSSPSLPGDTHVVGFRGRERLSEPYLIEIGFQTKDIDFQQDDAVLARATLKWELGAGAEPYVINGVLASVELLHEMAGNTLYRAVLVPKLWQLTLTQHSNIWVDMAIPDIITEVLEWSGLTSDEFELRLDESYDPRELVAQYKEDNLSFISRWMERLGMFYFFEQGDDVEKLVIVDGKSFSGDTYKPALRYVPGSAEDSMALEAFSSFRSKSSALPAKVELLDYDYLAPTLDVRATFDVASNGVGEISRFGDDNFLTPGTGTTLAKIRAQELLARQRIYRARGRVFHLHPGLPFLLEDHPRADLNDKTYLVTAVEHYGNQSGSTPLLRDLLDLEEHDVEYVADVTAIKGDIQYRSPQRHEWPRVEGYESATVCGEADSEYAQIDEHGRYHVRVKFDESDLGDGKASCWVRMQQPYGGTNEGFHFPLVKNTEVLLWFMGGDPDRPVIAGVVPNVQTPSPVTVNNHTTNIIQTINLNLIEIEDTRNEQYIYVYCPVENTYIHMGVLKNDFNFILNTEGHVHFDIGGLQLIDIDLTLEENVKLDVTFNYDSNWIVNVKINNDVTIEGDQNLLVFGDVNWTVLGDYNAFIIGDKNFNILGDMKFFIIGDMVFVIVGDQKITILGDQITKISCDQKVEIGGDQIVNIGGDQNITITGKQNIDVQSDWKTNIFGHDIKMQFANSTEITIGLKNEIKIGMFNELMIAGKGEIFIGQKRAIALAGEMSMFMGAKLEMKLAIEMSIFAALQIEVGAAIKIAAVGGLDLEVAGGPKMETGSICLRTGAITLDT